MAVRVRASAGQRRVPRTVCELIAPCTLFRPTRDLALEPASLIRFPQVCARVLQSLWDTPNGLLRTLFALYSCLL